MACVREDNPSADKLHKQPINSHRGCHPWCEFRPKSAIWNTAEHLGGKKKSPLNKWECLIEMPSMGSNSYRELKGGRN